MFTKKVKIQFHDCDPAGILFYANVYRIAHDAYQQLLDDGLSTDYFNNNGMVFPIVKSTAEYFKPMKSSEVYNIKMMTSQLKDSSFELTYLFYDVDGNVHAEVKTVHVAVSKQSFQKIKLPADLYELLQDNYV